MRRLNQVFEETPAGCGVQSVERGADKLQRCERGDVPSALRLGRLAGGDPAINTGRPRLDESHGLVARLEAVVGPTGV